MKKDYMKESISIYNATELLHDKKYITNDEYNRIVNAQLHTIVGRMALKLDCDKETE